MGMTRRSFVGAALATPFVGAARVAHAAEIELKWGSSTPPDHPVNVHAAQACKRILDESNGRVRIQLFPGGQLGGDPDMLSQLRSGGLDLYSGTPPLLTSLVPAAGLSGVGFAFKDYDTVWAAMDGDVGRVMRASAAPLNIHVFERLWDNGFRQISTSARPIASPADLQGFKIRVAVVPLFFSMFQHLGAAPVTLNFSEVYTALQTRLVEGQENPLGLMYLAKFYEVQKFVSLTNHVWDGFVISANRRTFLDLPADVQQLVSRHINEAGLRQRDDIRKLNAEQRTKMESLGIKFNETDPKPFRDKLRQSGYYAEWKKKFGNEAFAALEKYTGALG